MASNSQEAHTYTLPPFELTISSESSTNISIVKPTIDLFITDTLKPRSLNQPAPSTDSYRTKYQVSSPMPLTFPFDQVPDTFLPNNRKQDPVVKMIDNVMSLYVHRAIELGREKGKNLIKIVVDVRRVTNFFRSLESMLLLVQQCDNRKEEEEERRVVNEVKEESEKENLCSIDMFGDDG